VRLPHPSGFNATHPVPRPATDGADLKIQKLEDGEAVADGAAGEGAEGGAEASAEVAGGQAGERTFSERLSTREEATPATPAPAPAAEAAEAAAGGGGECLDIVAPEGAALMPESPPWQDISLPTSPHVSPYLPISPHISDAGVAAMAGHAHAQEARAAAAAAAPGDEQGGWGAPTTCPRHVHDMSETRPAQATSKESERDAAIMIWARERWGDVGRCGEMWGG